MEFETRALTITVRPDDIVEIVPKEEWTEPDTLEIAKENVEAMRQAVDGQPRALLSRTASTYLSKEVMKYYSEANVGEVATAMLANSFGSRIVGNLFLKITGKSRGEAPIRIFSINERNASITWLKECIAEAKKKRASQSIPS